MDILLNGTPTSIPEHSTIAQLIEHKGLAARRIATEVNGTIVPRGEHASRVLSPGDRVELVHALGGG